MDCTTLDNTIETPTVAPVMVAPNATTPSTLTPIPGDFSDSAIPSYIRDFLAAVKPDVTMR